MIGKYLIIDTETSGLFDFSRPADASGQPRLAHLAMILMQENVVGFEYDAYVRPDGWEMTPETTAINGLTTEFLRANGRPVTEVLASYVERIRAGYVVVAHNAQFDTKVMRGELRRAGMPDLFEGTPNICTMRASTDIVKLPAKSGRGYKFPKLEEACKHFGIVQPKKHEAMADAKSCLAIFRRLVELDAIPEARVHYAKRQPSLLLDDDIPTGAQRQAAKVAPPKASERGPMSIGSGEVQDRSESTSPPIPGPGHNNPPSKIDLAREAYDALAKFLAGHPDVDTQAEADEAGLLRERAKLAVAEMESERRARDKPLEDQVKAINAEYAPVRDSITNGGDRKKKPGLLEMLGERLAAFLSREEAKRVAQAEAMRREAERLEAAARAAEAAEREAHDDARHGVLADVAKATETADAAFGEFRTAQMAARVAEQQTRVVIPSRLGGRGSGLRGQETLTVTDPVAAITALAAAGPVSEKVLDAIVSAARAYRQLTGRLPNGVTRSTKQTV